LKNSTLNSTVQSIQSKQHQISVLHDTSKEDVV